MKRTVAVLMFLFVVLLGALFPFENAFAGSIDNIFHVTATGGSAYGIGANWYLDTNHFKLEQDQTYPTKKDSIKFNLSFDLLNNNADSTAKDSHTPNNFFDKDDTFGLWDNIIDSDMEKTTENGIFFKLYKDDGTDIGQENGNYKILPPPSPQAEYLTNGQLPQLYKSGALTNLGLYIWGINPQDNFFGKTKDFRINFPVTDLQPNTKYKARVIVIIDGACIDSCGTYSNTVSFTTPDTDPVSNADINGGNQSTTTTDEEKTIGSGKEVECTWDDGVVHCLTVGYYTIGTYVSGAILGIVGKLFDAFLAISIGNTIYDTTKANFVYLGWKICRDIANIFFIFVLLYTAIGTMLGLHGVDYKKVIVKVILMGLLINFSLFFTRVIIDTGNVLSRVFYSAITIKESTPSPKTSQSDVEEKSISKGILNGVNPQKILLNVDVHSTAQIFLTATMVIIFNLVCAWVLFMSAAFFAGRIGVLWMSMLFAPVAFASNLMPSLDKGLKQLGMHQWLSGLMSASFKAPVFLFLIYIIIQLTQSSFIGSFLSLNATKDPIEIAVITLLPLMLIMRLLIQAKDTAKDMAGQFGEIADGMMKAAVGVGAMAITGGAAALGSSTIGSFASRTANNEAKMNSLKEKASKGDKLAMFQLKSIDKLKSASFDARQTGLGNTLSKATGVNMNTGSGLLSAATFGGMKLGTDDRAGGFDARIARKQQKMEADAKFLSGYTGGKEEKQKLKDQEKDLEAATEAKDRLKEEIKIAKDRNDDKKVELLTHDLEKTNSYIDAIKNGKHYENEQTVVFANGQQQTFTKKDYRSEVKDSNGNAVMKEVSIKKRKDAIDNSDKAMVKEFWNTQREKSGVKKEDVHGIKRNHLGQITELGHVDFKDVSLAKRDLIRSLRDLTRNMGAGIVTGNLAGSGWVGGGIGFGIGLGDVLLSQQMGKMDYQAVHNAMENHKAHSYHSGYHSPNKGIFDMFSGLGSGGGHGGGGHGHDDHGHDDHGGGHDDHGGHH